LDKEVAEMKTLKAKSWTVPITAMEMKLIPPGEFVMGSPETERYRRKNEVQHKVKISKPFYMGAFEVTQRQFYYLTIPDYDFFAWKRSDGPLHVGGAYCHKWGAAEHLGFLLDHPMETFSWATAVKYCQRLTEFERQAGRLPEGYEYRLPTEAEWEYACRAGTKSYFNTDVDLATVIKNNSKTQRANTISTPALADLGTFAFNGHRVGPIGKERTPNAFGLHDMHGNVYEYTLDTYAPYKTDKKALVDPVNLENEANQEVFVDEKVVRGGCHLLRLPKLKKGEKAEDKADEHEHYMNLRSAARSSTPSNFDFNTITGMRIVLAPKIDAPMPVDHQAKTAKEK
jgi:formylglycine-generating enzyme required for sulfatase activity